MRAIRGAVQFSADNKTKIIERIKYLVKEMINENHINEADIVSIFFTITDDIRSINPAAALRNGGEFKWVPLFCAKEPDIEGSLPMVVRVLLHASIDTSNKELKHIYIDGAEKLRPDIKK